LFDREKAVEKIQGTNHQHLVNSEGIIIFPNMAKVFRPSLRQCVHLFGSKASIDFWGRQEKGRQIHGFAEPR
jgi:hypothetical protein